MAYDEVKDDNVQHGIDDKPTHDAEKGAGLGAVGGAIVGGLAGGPVGAIIGAVAGGIASGAAVAAVDRHDNDNTVTGLGDGATRDLNDPLNDDVNAVDPNLPAGSRVGVYSTPGNGVPGVQTGGRDYDGTPDERGITEKAADAITGDRIDDKTGKPVAGYGSSYDNSANAGYGVAPGNGVPGVQTGGRDYDGTPDERGITEKAADAITGNRIDDKTGKPVI